MTVSERDRIFSRISKLAGTDYLLEIEIPYHLNGVFRALEKKGYEERRAGFRTMIRFDDQDETIELVRRPRDGSSGWEVVGLRRTESVTLN